MLIAQTVFEEENFDKILFIPAYNPPHKKNITSINHRLKMLKIALDDNPNFEISDLEIRRKGVSYSIDTILSIKNQFNGKKDRIYYLIEAIVFKNLKVGKIQKNIEYVSDRSCH